MPTPDASQYTQFRRYASVAGDALGSVGSKISPFNTAYSIPLLTASSQALFLPSANKEKKFPPPPGRSPNDPIWSTQIGSGTNYTYVNGNVICEDGTIVVAGETVLKVLFAGSETYDHYVSFVARYSSSGSFISGITFGSGNTYVRADSITVDSQGNIYVTGSTCENLTAYRPYHYGQNAFAVKFTSEFELVWLKEFGSGWNYTYSFTSLLAPNGYLYVAVLTNDSDWNNITSSHSQIGGQDSIVLVIDPVTGETYSGFTIGDQTGIVKINQLVWIPEGSYAPVGTIPNLIAVVGTSNCLSLNGVDEGVPGVEFAGNHGGRYGYIYMISEFLEPGPYWGIGSGSNNHYTYLFGATLLSFPYGVLLVAAGATTEYLQSDGEHNPGEYLAGGGQIGFTAGLFGNIESAGIYPIRYVGNDSCNTYISLITSDINQQVYISGTSNENNDPTNGGAQFPDGRNLGFALKTHFCSDNTAYIQIGKPTGSGFGDVEPNTMASDILGDTYISGGTFQNLTNGSALSGDYAEDGFLVKAYNPANTYNTPIFMKSDTSQCDPSGTLYFRITFTGTLTVDWGDGTVDTIAVTEDEQEITHTYQYTEIFGIAIDVSQGGSISYLRANSVGLLSINVTKCPTITYLRVDNNSLVRLDVSQCSGLTYLRCDNNYIDTLDVSNLAGLTYLRFDNNYINIVHFEGCGLSSITNTTLEDAINQIDPTQDVYIYIDPVQNSGFESGATVHFGNSNWVFIMTPGAPSLGDLSYQFPSFGRGVAYGNGIFVAVGDSNPTGPSTNVLVSIDGGQSFKIPSGISSNLFPGGSQPLARSVVYGNGVWVVTGDDSTNGSSGQTMKYSIDNAGSWYPCSGAMPGTRATSVAFNNDQYNPVWVATGDANNEDYTIFTSKNGGINWSGADTQFGTGEGRAVAYGNGNWVVTGHLSNNETVILYSNDNGTSWHSAAIPSELSNNSSSRHGLAFGLGQNGSNQFVLTIGYNSAFVSSDGTEWVVAIDGSTDTSHIWRPPPFGNDPTEWTFGAGVAFSDNTWMFSSGTNHRQPFFAYDPTNGDTGDYGGWRVEQTGDYIPGYGNGVAQGSGSWVVVGSNNGSGNTIISSKNGLAWSGSEITPVPQLSNLTVASLFPYSAGLTWTESGTVTSRSVVTYEYGTQTVVNGTVTGLIPGSCSIGGVGNSSPGWGPYTATVTLTNSYGSVSASITVSITCFLGSTKLQTRNGSVCASDVVLGTELLQPDGSYSKVVKVRESTVSKSVPAGDARLFADESEKMIVTAWHKIRFADEKEEVKADIHPRLHEVFREMPFMVYHFELEDISHKILIANADIIAESCSVSQSW